MRIAVAEANAQAVAGENKSKAEIADANATLRVREAEAYQTGETRQRVAQAAVLEAQYMAQARAAEAQGKKIEAEKRAELEALAKAVKAQVIVDAEAAAQKRRIEAEGEAAAIFAKLEAEARGNYEILAKKGEGLKRIVESCGGSQAAFQMLMLEHIDALSKTAAEAISNVKFDKIVVWDGGSGDGKSTTAGFLRGLAGALPPVMTMMRDIGGVEMPAYFGKLEDPPPAAPAASASDASANGASASGATSAEPVKPKGAK
jgi:flotillin